MRKAAILEAKRASRRGLLLPGLNVETFAQPAGSASMRKFGEYAFLKDDPDAIDLAAVAARPE
jgi:hypothetical protein